MSCIRVEMTPLIGIFPIRGDYGLKRISLLVYSMPHEGAIMRVHRDSIGRISEENMEDDHPGSTLFRDLCPEAGD